MKDFLIVCALLIFAASCGSSQNKNATVLTYISVTPANSSMPAGATKQFSATGVNDDGTFRSLGPVTWSSSTPSVATVNSSGLATAVSAGSTVITATAGNLSGSTNLIVTNPTLSSLGVVSSAADEGFAKDIDVNPADRVPLVSAPKGVTLRFAARGGFADGTTHEVAAVWRSSNPSVASIDGAGLAAAISEGRTVVTADALGESAGAVLEVTSAVLSSLSTRPHRPAVSAGETEQLAAVASYSDGSSFGVTGQARWASSDPSVATVAETGLVTAVAAGTATFTAEFGGASTETAITVIPGF